MSDVQQPLVGGSDPGRTPPNHPEEGEDKKQEDPLIQLLQQLNKDHGTIKTAKRLGVDRKTVWRALQAGRLTPWLRKALERERQEVKVAAEREAAGGDQLELRVEGLERRLQDVETQLAGGLSRLRAELTAVREEVRTLAWTRQGGAPSGDVSTLRSPHRTYPQVVTVEASPDDERVFGEGMPLIAEWRDQRERFKAHWPSVEGLEAEVRMLELELELELIEERRLTLPPGQLPWEWDQRRREARRRTQRLGTARSNLRRARWRWRLLVLAGVGWRRSASE
ncbi:MAG: hypothetical protein OXG27_13320 [Chloroflexi bacterium]|nr:hypothetical protein [Chloroflexota bacterium]